MDARQQGANTILPWLRAEGEQVLAGWRALLDPLRAARSVVVSIFADDPALAVVFCPPEQMLSRQKGSAPAQEMQMQSWTVPEDGTQQS